MFFRYWLYRKSLRPDAIAITRSFRPTKRIFAYLEHSEYQFTFNKQNLEFGWSEKLTELDTKQEILLS
jgi:hypothetical protein